ncbi:succinate dehydrogenase/fumarate reductase flavoprotein subunit [Azospirillum agricola]|uniref:FAD-dependent oxidoreductase n=1 Tax=Azospirillum agricola TaxID=1720247 RepID=UPI001AE4BE79|nr:FAD-dependent oxidoreductase [Azospirillum agricola]MBP2232574.1 succinate dehydrogenase/fumarate reductase flavoprotein subunit [Azospirillum agricola]
MPTQKSQDDVTCDVLVIGSGAGGLATAVTAAKHGLDVLVVEKEPYYGGTMAFSGGFLWVPGNRHAKAEGIRDTPDAARAYLKNETGNFHNAEGVEAFLAHGPEMLDFFDRETEVKFVASAAFPDYHPDVEGGAAGGRSVLAAPFDARRLGPELKRLRPPLRTITFVGMMFNSGNEVKHFFNATRSLESLAYVVRRLIGHGRDLLVHRRGMRLTSGNALAARLAKSAFDLGVPIWTEAPARELISDGGGVTGAVVSRDGRSVRVTARKGVVLASGGFPLDRERVARQFPHVRQGGEHLSPAPEGNTGDGWRMAERLGAQVEESLPNAAAWIPVSKVRFSESRTGVFPHLIDRFKPGVVAVNRHGRRFVNETNSYHDVGVAMIRTCEGEGETAAWLVCDHPTLRKYGLGFAKPFPLPLTPYLRSGYLLRGRTLRDLARVAGIDPDGLEATIASFNRSAATGEDPAFGRGANVYNRYLGDPEHRPNPCVAPVERGPFYAVKMVMGDLGTFNGIRTDRWARVIGGSGEPIPGLFAVGNDAASIMGGNYPGAGITLGPILAFGYILGLHLAGKTA